MKTNYSTTEINRNFKIKVFGFINGTKINTLVGVSRIFLVGGMSAHDFLADSLGIQRSASVDEIINNLKSILQ